jgi:hypothetical protein
LRLEATPPASGLTSTRPLPGGLRVAIWPRAPQCSDKVLCAQRASIRTDSSVSSIRPPIARASASIWLATSGSWWPVATQFGIRQTDSATAIDDAKHLSKIDSPGGVRPVAAQTGNEPALLNFAVTIQAGGLFVHVFEKSCPNGGRKPRVSQNPCHDRPGQTGFLVICLQERPGSAARQSKRLGLIVKRVEASCLERFGDLSDLVRLSLQHSQPVQVCPHKGIYRPGVNIASGISCYFLNSPPVLGACSDELLDDAVNSLQLRYCVELTSPWDSCARPPRAACRRRATALATLTHRLRWISLLAGAGNGGFRERAFDRVQSAYSNATLYHHRILGRQCRPIGATRW